MLWRPNNQPTQQLCNPPRKTGGALDFQNQAQGLAFCGTLGHVTWVACWERLLRPLNKPTTMSILDLLLASLIVLPWNLGFFEEPGGSCFQLPISTNRLQFEDSSLSNKSEQNRIFQPNSFKAFVAFFPHSNLDL